MKLRLTILSLVLALAQPLSAGLHYKSRQWAEGQGDMSAASFEVESWIDGPKAKIVFVKSGQPMMPTGSYLLTTDGGETIYLVNPAEGTYSKWDIDAMLRMVGSVLQSMGPMLNIEISDPEVVALGAKDGGSVAGVSTKLYEYRTSYRMQIKIIGIKQVSDVRMEQQFWVTESFDDVALGVWLRKGGAPTGNEDLDRLIAAEVSKQVGFPLKTVQVTTTSDKKGRETVTRNFSEVHELDETDVPESTFVLDPNLTLVPAPLPVGEGQEGSENPLKGIFGRRDG